ncbi:MAG: carbohydrate ABC transporter permease [Ruminococcus sp.]|nr:carbohydrate ABC transporter permease [Ruminococcus sp.]
MSTLAKSSAKDSYSLKIKLKSGLLFTWFVILTLICLLPLYILIINATREHGEIVHSISLLPGSNLAENFKTVTESQDYLYIFDVWAGYKNSLIITACSTVFTVFFSALTAYGIHVYDFKLKEVSYTVILLVMMIPVQVTSVGFVEFMNSIGLINTYWPLVLPAIAAPSVVYFMRSYMKSSFPLDIVEAARIDGCSEFRTFIQIAIPMMKPAIAVQSIFAFVASWNNFYTPNMILLTAKTKEKTLPMMISAIGASDTLNDYGSKYMAIALTVLPIVVAYVILSKYIVAGVALGGVKE